MRSPLLGGASEREGVVEVCVNGTYLPVSLDNGNFSTREASIICMQLMPNKGKYVHAITLESYIHAWCVVDICRQNYALAYK